MFDGLLQDWDLLHRRLPRYSGGQKNAWAFKSVVGMGYLI